MKRRLQRAYDSMTMPDSCAQRIEERLRQQEKAQKNGKYVKIVAPEPVRRRNWTAVVAAVCLVLVLSVGGSVLFLSGMETPPAQATAPVRETIPATKPAPGDYSLVTDIPGEDVEAFVAEVRQNVIDGDWEAFSEKVQYPITILDKRIGAGGLVGLTLRNTINETFVYNIQAGGNNQLFCNWQGICMGDGNIWINEVEGELKITAINDMFAYFVDSEDFVFVETEDGNVAITAYDGMAEEITLPIGYNQRTVTQIGTGMPVIRNGNAVKILWLPESVTVIGEKAFANAPALESVFFRGDAPPEAEGVFDGSANVTVYYRPETKGWGDTWCGRPTMQYGEGHVSLGAVTVKEKVPAVYGDILAGKQVKFYGNGGMQTIEQHCISWWGAVSVDDFTLADLDGDGVLELIFSAKDGLGGLCAYMVVYLDGDTLCTHPFRYRDMNSVNADGTFLSDGKICRLTFEGPDGCQWTETEEDLEWIPARWHDYPVAWPEAVLATYYVSDPDRAGTETGSLLYYFEELARESENNDWAYLANRAARKGLVAGEFDDHTAVLMDPASPGCLMYGTLNDNGRFTSIGYYISNADGERKAEIQDLLSDSTQREMGTLLEEVMDYLQAGQLEDFRRAEMTMEHEAIRTLLTAFVEGCTAKDTKGLAQYLTEDYSGTIPEELAGMRVQIISFENFPDGAVEEGECLEVSLSMAEVENPAELHRLNVEVVKTAEGWKIRACELAE